MAEPTTPGVPCPEPGHCTPECCEGLGFSSVFSKIACDAKCDAVLLWQAAHTAGESAVSAIEALWAKLRGK